MKLRKDSASKPKTSAKAASRQAQATRILKIVGSWLAALIVALALQHFVFQSYQVFGHSMEPALQEGDYLIISKWGVTWGGLRGSEYVPHRGQIIVIKSPLDNTRLIKRVIALPGERVSVSGGKVLVYNQSHPNGFDPYQELGIPSRYASGQLTMTVPINNIFVVGDNREAGGSLDSRNELGPVPLDDVVGKLVLRLWPPSKFDRF